MEGEQDSETTQLQQERDALEKLKDKMADIENKAQTEKSQVCQNRHIPFAAALELNQVLWVFFGGG